MEPLQGGVSVQEERTEKTSAALVATWWRNSKRIDVVLGDHAVSQGAQRYFGGYAATVRYCRELMKATSTLCADKIFGWLGFPGQPLAERSIIMRDFTQEISIPLVYNRAADKIVLKTIMVKSPGQRFIPCGGESRMSLVLDYDGSQVVTKLRIGLLFYADTPENREIPYKSPAELSGKQRG